MSLNIKNLSVTVEETEIIHGLSLEIPKGQVHAIMGPNGSGKSTLANTLLGHPKYSISSGSVVVDDIDVTEQSPDQRAKAGLFLSMQYPPEIGGVSLVNFLRLSYEAIKGEKQNPITFFRQVKEVMQTLSMDEEFAKRSINTGFSGGEKKRAEILQMLVLKPTYAILDETDSGLDVDALKIVAEGINRFKSADTGVLLITHYNRLLEYVVPDVVHIMVDGRIVKSGDASLAHEVEQSGYTQWIS